MVSIVKVPVAPWHEKGVGNLVIEAHHDLSDSMRNVKEELWHSSDTHDIYKYIWGELSAETTGVINDRPTLSRDYSRIRRCSSTVAGCRRSTHG